MVATSVEGNVQLVTFKLGQEEYGIDIMQVREIIKLVPITRIPGAAATVEGVMELRNEIIPVVDLRSTFGIDGVPGIESRIIVVSVNSTTIGLMVDAVSEVLRLRQDSIEPLPDVVKVSLSTSNCVRGVARLDKRLVLVVDLDRLLSDVLALTA